jgi:hypothetical protein
LQITRIDALLERNRHFITTSEVDAHDIVVVNHDADHTSDHEQP